MKSTAWKSVVFAVVGGAVCVVAGLGVQSILRADPLKRYRSLPSRENTAGIELTNFDWKAYDGPVLLAEAHVSKAEVGRDRDRVNLSTVTRGKFYDKAKVAFGFEATNAVYYNRRNALSGSGKARVFNEHLDLASTTFDYDPSKKALTVPTKLMGKLEGGDVKADHLTYKLEDKAIEIKGVRWSGMVAQDQTKRRWSFGPQDGQPAPSSTLRGPVTTFTKLKATDGEVIILADGAEYNRDTDVLTAKGHVQYFGTDANLACEQVVVTRKEKKAVMTGHVSMLIKPEGTPKPEEVKIPPVSPVVPEQIAKDRPPAPPPDRPQSEQEKQLRTGENLRDYPIAVTALKVEYWYGKGSRRAVITGSPQARQELDAGAWRMVWADHANYDGEKDLLDLRSKGSAPDVRMLNSLGDDMHAVSVLVSTKKGDDMMDATGVTMDVNINEEEEGIDRTKKEGKSGGTPPPLSGPLGRGRRH